MLWHKPETEVCFLIVCLFILASESKLQVYLQSVVIGTVCSDLHIFW